MTRRAAIAGAGIGGLSAAIALARSGWQVRVFEQADGFEAVGAGIQISPNGTRILAEWGLLDALESAAFEPEAIEMRLPGWAEPIFRLPLIPLARARWQAPYLHIHRADLIAVLSDALDQLQPDAVQFGQAVTGYENTTSGVNVVTDAGVAEFDLLVGADGVHSKLRQQIVGPSPARFTGVSAWRMTVPAAAINGPLPPPTACIWAGTGRHAVTTRICGGDVINFVGIIEDPDWQEEGWKITGNAADLQQDFQGLDPVIDAILAHADHPNRWALLVHAPLDAWADGAAVLLGDAAHPMLPSLAQGGVQAIEDAAVLAASLAQKEDIPSALEHYFTQRQPRTAKIQRRALSQLKLYHQRGGMRKFLRYAPLWIASRFLPRLVAQRLDWIMAHDALGGLPPTAASRHRGGDE